MNLSINTNKILMSNVNLNLLLTKYNQTKFFIEYIYTPNDVFEYHLIIFENNIQFQIKLKDTKLQKKLQVNFTDVIYEQLYKKSTSELKDLMFEFKDVDENNQSPQYLNNISKFVNKCIKEYKSTLNLISEHLYE